MAKSTREGQGGTTGARGGEAVAAGTKAAIDSGSAVAEGMHAVAQAWSDYAQQVVQRTTEASEALLKCRNFSDMLGVQAELMRGHLQAFLDQSTKLAEITNRMAARSMDVLRLAGGEAITDKNRR